MRRFLLVTSALALAFAGGVSVSPLSVEAAGAKRVDPFLKKAIEESAGSQAKPVPDSLASKPAQDTPNKLLEDLTPMPPDDLADVEEDLARLEENQAEEPEEEQAYVPSPPQDLPEPEAQTAKAPESGGAGDSDKGYKFGSFRLLPSVSANLRHDDNIRAVPMGEQDDMITEIRPLLLARLEGSDHDVEIEAGYRGNFYLDHDGENTHDFHIGTRGHVQTAENVRLPFEAGFIYDHEAREDDLTQQLPTDKTRNKSVILGGGVEVTDKRNKMGVALLGRYLRERFGDGADASGNEVIRSDADRATWEAETKLFYNLAVDKQFYGTATFGAREYERRNYQSGSFSGESRDGDFYELRLGFVTERDGFLKGNFNIGYKEWAHDSTVIGTADDFIFHIDTKIMFSPETTMSLVWDRDFTEDDELIHTARITDARIALGHQFTDAWSAGAAGTYEELKFIGSDREDDTYGLSFYSDYMINDRYSAGLEYRIESKDSAGSVFEYDKQVIMARVKGEL